MRIVLHGKMYEIGAIKQVFQRLKDGYLLPDELKEEQLDIISRVCNGKHVLGVLPTGFGKSLTFVLAPIIMDEVCTVQATWPLYLIKELSNL